MGSEDGRRLDPLAEAFAGSADSYDRARPGYDDEPLDWAFRELRLDDGSVVLDLAAGTGKLSEALAPRAGRLIAVEPLPEMRRLLAARAPEATLLDGTAEQIPIGDGSVDAVFVGEAFHWFDGERALSELARVLRPGGPIALVWNVRDESVAWIRGLTHLIEPYRGDTPSHRSLRWRAAFDASDAFPPPELTSFPYVHDTTREGIVARVSSISFIATLAPDEREQVAAAVRRLVPADQVAFAYRTDVWISRRA